MNSPKLYWSILALLAAVGLNALGSYIIYNYFPDRFAVDDLLFRLTPYVGWTQYLTDLENIFCVGLLAFYIFWGRSEKIVYALSTFAVMEFARGILVALTPLGGTFGNDAYYGLTKIRQYGAFPSGHFAVAVMCYFLIDQKEAPTLKLLAFIGIFVEGISLILSRGHYSIDIAGGFLIAYFAYTIMLKYKAKLTIPS